MWPVLFNRRNRNYMAKSVFVIGFILLSMSILISQNEEQIGKYETEKYSTVAIEFPIIMYWDSIKVTQNNVEYLGIEKYLDDNQFYIVYENLKNDEYTIEHKSDFNEVYAYTINLESDTILTFPNKKLKYDVVDIQSKDLETILNCKQLQFQIAEVGCHQLNKYYYEIYNGTTHNGARNESVKKIILTNQQFVERISNMILNAKTDERCNNYSCFDYYTLKAGQKLYSFYDCCVSKKLIQRLRNGLEENK